MKAINILCARNAELLKVKVHHSLNKIQYLLLLHVRNHNVMYKTHLHIIFLNKRIFSDEFLSAIMSPATYIFFVLCFHLTTHPSERKHSWFDYSHVSTSYFCSCFHWSFTAASPPQNSLRHPNPSCILCNSFNSGSFLRNVSVVRHEKTSVLQGNWTSGPQMRLARDDNRRYWCRVQFNSRNKLIIVYFFSTSQSFQFYLLIYIYI
jgi:hypothetical protein